MIIYLNYFLKYLVVEKAGQNMQHTMIASYIAILLGYITMDDKVIYTIFHKFSEIITYLYLFTGVFGYC